ncbi:MAG: adenosylcobinamide-GDP ribazoletransferase [Verrucomicrobiota bacterium]
MKEQIRIFFTALMFYSRIPCPKWVDHSEEYLNKATRFFPLIGWVVGGFSFLLFLPFFLIDEIHIGIVFSMIASIWITGAFHEDGFADSCDGFGGGWTKSQILEIMKDSRVGAFGLIGMILILLLKFLLLERLLTGQRELWIALAVIISAHALSRFITATMIFTHEYSREDAKSKVKPVSKNVGWVELILAATFGIAPLFLFQDYWIFLTIIPVYGAKALLGRYFQKWIEGYTGDCLGATQQVTEIVFYLSVLILWKFT